jgi:hypothetical protein
MRPCAASITMTPTVMIAGAYLIQGFTLNGVTITGFTSQPEPTGVSRTEEVRIFGLI